MKKFLITLFLIIIVHFKSGEIVEFQGVYYTVNSNNILNICTDVYSINGCISTASIDFDNVLYVEKRDSRIVK